MKIQSIFLAFLIIICLAMAACGSEQFQTPTIVPSPTFTPTPTITLTPRIQALLGRAATLYSGPGNVNYEALTELSSGTTVYPSGIYGDFVQVTATIGGNDVTGFIWKNALDDLPGGLPILDRFQVPWEPFFLPTCSPGKYDAETSTVTFPSISADEGYYTLSAVWAVEAPIRIQIKALTAQDNGNSSEWNNSEWSDIKIIGRTQMSIRSRDVDGKYEIDIFESTERGNVAVPIVLEQSSSRPIQILFDQPADGRPIGTSFSVLDETGQVLKTVDLTTLSEVNLPNGIFPDGLYFGTDTMPDSSLVVTGLAIGSQPSGQWIEQANIIDYLNSPGLSRLAEGKDITIGTDFELSRAIDRRYCQVMQHDFNLAILSNFSWKPFWVGEGEYAWGTVDRAVDFAIQHGWRVRASHLVWGAPEAIPDWLMNGTYTRDEFITILENHIKTVIGHFRGRVQEWNIANESIERIVCERSDFYDFWYRKIGPDYIKLAFQTAREADPDGILILNSGGNFPPNYPPFMNCLNPTINRMHDTVIALNSGATKLVDVIGMQMHLLTAWDTKIPPGKADVLQIMQDFSELGVRVDITEMDVNLNFVQSNYPTQEERWAYQAGIYKDMVDACLESGVCDSFATMGISDSMSWITTSCAGCWNEPQPNGDPLMFDGNFIPKPAYFAVRDALAGTIAAATPTP